MIVRIGRGRVGSDAGIDVSRKSASVVGLPFAPPWSLIMDYKKGRIYWNEYRILYRKQLEAVSISAIATLHEEGLRRGGNLLVLCYCQSGLRCHTRLLVEWLDQKFPDWFSVIVE